MRFDRPHMMLNVRGGIRLAVPDNFREITPYVLLEQEDWFEEEIRFVRRWLSPGMRAVDIGASYGVYAAMMARAVGETGRVWAFEPNARSADFLQANLEANGFANSTLLRAAVSNSISKLSFTVLPQAELNSIAPDGDGSAQTTEVSGVTLDASNAEMAWSDIDFLKLDVEGHELKAIEGGSAFLRAHSPLIMLEVRAGDDKLDLRALHKLAELGYQSYRLLPGPLMLVPFRAGENPPLDRFQLNLFACKQDRAERLMAQGVLAELTSVDSQMPSEAAWTDHLPGLPFARELAPRWLSPSQVAASPGRERYMRGLCCFAHSRDQTRPPPERLSWLAAAFSCVTNALTGRDTAPRRLTHARLAWELGERSKAIESLDLAARKLARRFNRSIEEPFLAPSPRYERVPTGGDPAGWLQCAIVEQHEKLRAYSSLFVSQDSRVGSIVHLPHRSQEIDRRKLLVRGLLGGPGEIVPSPNLAMGTDENLNPELWSPPRFLLARA